jgi:hypothetical protein
VFRAPLPLDQHLITLPLGNRPPNSHNKQSIPKDPEGRKFHFYNGFIAHFHYSLFRGFIQFVM